jgi:HAD superfamily hydrolase (TIGR01490 family)
MAQPQKRVAFFDLDNTILQGSSLYFLGRGMYRRGYFTKHDIANFMLANLRFRLRGEDAVEIDKFRDAAQVFIAGHKVDDLQNLASEVYDQYVSPALWKGTIDIANQHLANGDEVWLVTATPKEMAEFIAERLGFTGALGTRAEIANGIYTGQLCGAVLHGKEKALAIRELAKEHNFDLPNSFAYSDSHHDIPLLEAVGNPRAINPDTLLQIRAIRDHWPIHDYRRARALKAFFGPIAAKGLSIVAFFAPRKRGQRT